jgi:hypothetical protein
MKRSIYFDDFVEAFEEMGRIEHFSREGLKALFDYLEEFEADTGIEIELDVIALCVDFTEYSDFEEFKWHYSDYVEEHNIQNLDDLVDHTIVIRVDEKAFIIQDF